MLSDFRYDYITPCTPEGKTSVAAVCSVTAFCGFVVYAIENQLYNAARCKITRAFAANDGPVLQ